MAPRYTDLVLGLPASVPFVGPETQERQMKQPFVARIGANENVFGPSPQAIAAMEHAAADAWKYGDPENFDLREALAAHYKVSQENIVVGEGIDGLLGYLVRMFIAPGDPVVTSDGAYPTFNFHVAGYGGVLHKVPYTSDHEDPMALVSKAKEVRAKLVYIANPDNPMGSWHDAAVIQDMIEALPEDTLLLLDEAYIELAPKGTAPLIAIEDPRVIRLRTFSKGYGLAGARVGYALGAKDLITAFNKVRNHFGMCRISQAGALAALEDQDWLHHIFTKISTAREQIAKIALKNDLSALPSATNFVTVDCGEDGVFAKTIVQDLAQHGVFIRMPFVAPHNRCIRISVGTQDDLDALAKHLPDALSKARATL